MLVIWTASIYISRSGSLIIALFDVVPNRFPAKSALRKLNTSFVCHCSSYSALAHAVCSPASHHLIQRSVSSLTLLSQEGPVTFQNIQSSLPTLSLTDPGRTCKLLGLAHAIKISVKVPTGVAAHSSSPCQSRDRGAHVKTHLSCCRTTEEQLYIVHRLQFQPQA